MSTNNNNKVDTEYFRIVNDILTNGKLKKNRTGIDCLTIAGAMFQHNMSDGFPLLTSRKMPFRSTKVELEFFIKGLRSKKWLQDRGCNYWDEWANPERVPYATDPETKKKMLEEDDLGLVYGTQWRDFHDADYPWGGEHVDQLKNLVNTLKTNPDDRRMIVTAWNPLALTHMALPPCHYGFQVTVIDGYLNLAWNQRSIDIACNQTIVTYALLLHLLAKEAGLKEGKLIGFFMDVHAYVPHIEGLKKQLTQETFPSPSIRTDKFTSIFDWEYTDTELINYQSSPAIKYEVAV
jgi:thymidylate synthase